MIVKYKLAKSPEMFTVEGYNLTLIKVALLEHHGRDMAIHVFQKTLENSILLFCPTIRDLQNLVKGNYRSYVSQNRTAITEAINSIKGI